MLLSSVGNPPVVFEDSVEPGSDAISTDSA